MLMRGVSERKGLNGEGSTRLKEERSYHWFRGGKRKGSGRVVFGWTERGNSWLIVVGPTRFANRTKVGEDRSSTTPLYSVFLVEVEPGRSVAGPWMPHRRGTQGIHRVTCGRTVSLLSVITTSGVHLQYQYSLNSKANYNRTTVDSGLPTSSEKPLSSWTWPEIANVP